MRNMSMNKQIHQLPLLPKLSKKNVSETYDNG